MNDSYLMKLTMFAGLFFASAVTLGGDGGGNADGGGEGGAGGETDAGGAPETITEEPSEISEGAEETDAEAPDEAAGSREAPDGRTMPNHVKQALAKLKETDPKAADIARRAYYEAGDFKRVFPSVAEARDARDLIESVGGSEGISDLRSRVDDYAGELNAMSAGDPKVIEDLAHDFPQGLVKLVPHALSKLQQIDSGAYERVSSGIVSSVLRDKGVASSVNRLMELISDGKQTQAHEMAQKLAQWIAGVDEFAKSKPTNEPDPREQQLSEREKALQTQEQNIFGRRIQTDVLDAMNEAISKQLAPLFKGRNLTKQQKDGLINAARGHISNEWKRNDSYQQRMRSLLREGDRKAIQRYIRGQLDSGRVNRAVKTAWSERGFAASARRQSPPTNGNQAPAMLSAKPSADQIDWTKDRDRSRYMRGESTLKNGKVVRWNWQ